MPKGPERQKLDRYLDSAQERVVYQGGDDWVRKGDALRHLAVALRTAAQQAELHIGEQTLTGPKVRQGMEESAASMETKGQQLDAAGQALVIVSDEVERARSRRDAMVDLGAKPDPLAPLSTTSGVPPTAEEIQKHSSGAAAREAERSSWQAAWDQQEAQARILTQGMDQAFLAAIPPMKDIHGQEDPTEPPANVPSGPGGPLLPGAPAPIVPSGSQGPSHPGEPEGGKPGLAVLGPADGGGGTPTPLPDITPTPGPGGSVTPHPVGGPTITTPTVPSGTPHAPVTAVLGTPQGGIDYAPTGTTTPAASGPAGAVAPGASAGASAGAALAGGAVAALGAGAIRGGSPGAPVRPGSSGIRPGSVKGIGSTVRSGGPGALTRGGATPAGASRSGAAPARGAAAGSTAGRSSSSAAGRGAAGTRGTAGTAGTRGAAGARGTAGARGVPGATGANQPRGTASGKGPAGKGPAGSGAAGTGTAGRGSGGKGGVGQGVAGAGSAAGRSASRRERDTSRERDALVYEQDWLGDDDVAAGVLD